MSTADNELFGIIYGITDKPDWAVSQVHDALLAAGYRKPQQVTTIEELDALPVESVVRSRKGFVWEKFPDEDPGFEWWFTPGDARHYRRVDLPATVLHVGGAE